jgi:hypothetical protein
MILLIAAALMAAEAQDAAPIASPAAQKPAKPQKEKKVCRTDPDTGSILPKKTCKTQGEWDALSVQNAGALDEMRQMQQTQQMTSGSR